MTVTRESVARALEEASALGYRTVKDIASAMGIKGSSPLIKAVREELEAMVKDGLCDVRDHVKAGQMFRAKGVQVSAKMPTAVHRMMALIADGPKKAYELADAGVRASTMGYAADRGIAVRGPDGYEITDRGLAWLADKEAEFPALAEARAQMGIKAPKAEDPEPEEPEETEETEETEEAEPDEAREPEPPAEMPVKSPVKEPVKEPEPGPKPELPREANAIITELAEVTVYRIRYRTATGTGEATFGDPSAVLGDLTDKQWAVGKAIRIREKDGRTEFGHIVDDIWRPCL